MLSKPTFNCALITGSISGLGKTLADFIEKKGIRVIRTGTENFDLANRNERKGLLDLISKNCPDLIVNNAGFGLYGPSLNLSIDEQLKIIEVNCSALTEISLHGAAVLKKANQPGTILNISSGGAFLPFPTFNVYCASKAFVKNFSLALDSELKNSGIRVLCACPGQIATHFRARAAKGHPQTLDNHTMSAEAAVGHLWKQIETGKALYLFDWKTKLMVFVSYLIPRPLLNLFLKKYLKRRY